MKKKKKKERKGEVLSILDRINIWYVNVKML